MCSEQLTSWLPVLTRFGSAVNGVGSAQGESPKVNGDPDFYSEEGDPTLPVSAAYPQQLPSCDGPATL